MHNPHIVLYDPRTVAADVVEAVDQLAQAGRRVVVLTSSLLEHEAAALWQAGAAALLLKGTETSALLALIEALVAE